ncbi:YmgD family protein [Laribacter hongkongensis]|uniref:YmgD family protein n=1 Tax=Laribacter hongkongensis TaxID=168471 RepID=UPI001EFCDFC3|nr:YmgD family protein [Laribacter hongkongensis]MCG9095587.1 YmgD family protein [Laribacter hongkongensis]
MKKTLTLIALAAALSPLAAIAAPAAAGVPAEFFTTCTEANEMAKTDTAAVSDLIARLGNAAVEARDLKIKPRPDLDKDVIKHLNAYCSQDPNGLLITGMDIAMRQVAGEKVGK